MKKIAVVLCLFACCMSWAQKPTAKSQKTAGEKDWESLDKTFAAFIKTIENNDKPGFMAISLKEVDCIDCAGKPEFNEQGTAVKADAFFAIITRHFTTSPVYLALVKKGYTFSIAEIKDFKPKSLPKEYPKDLKLYEVWVPTYLKNELSKGHPGASHAFQFVKINGQFKFYGLISIP